MLLFLFASAASAIEVAPGISDREIIESLAGLKAGQKALEEKMVHRFAAMQQNIDQRFETMEQSIDRRFEAVDQRFDAVGRELSWIWNLQLVVIAGNFD